MIFINYKRLMLLLLVFSVFQLVGFGASPKPLNIGLARVSITPETPVRLTGYSSRDIPFEGVQHELWAKAMAFGDEKKGYHIIISVDLLGIPHRVTERVRDALAKEIGISPANLSICAAHTHSGPQIGNIVSHFHKPLDPDELADISLYAMGLVPKLKGVALEAIENATPSLVSHAKGEVNFAVNRRTSINPNGVSDHSLPVMRITDLNGKTKAVMLNYACHAVTLGPKNNVVHGDWVGEAQLQVEENLPEGAIAMVVIGCGADQNSSPRMNNENPKMDLVYAKDQRKQIADEVNRMLADETWKNIRQLPEGKMKYVELTFANMPDPKKLAEDAKGAGRTSNYSLLLLGRMARSGDIPEKINYPIQVWDFGKDLVMIFLAGEVVVDYAIRLKQELGEDRVWVNAYANDMPCYIPSLRVLKEGGYEAESAMIGYEKPSKFTEDVEEIIMNGIYSILPKSSK
ncbi:neutral/alkaline non-lysosomal ceramidase N-terminal domain-containing protein [Cyclobacterium sp. 1_MG-2023]|uniref:neutral/alkaline non-lysosomal ceramidase N-terminal domain-containing protein n=1 Tax=Cyclobacterium sp. 1_MG-2023 TaxID=3062681 RepID=UPI0026E462B2|nr:neutral/alkaline non-lysosomal ceramidase N-terminal domain-containing protein [Cyclobacterium sp. 1_MG-2023]MDO6436442.1 neutral/alkaline non-lysosomal ceramidase N-terminal domain-containing protein [Cyclobacterium sp. 1_MG-2023]